jgi:spore coat polysaccharide biosynthesis protein SpsF
VSTEVLVVMQARMSSTRLPGKVMRPVMGEPMLAQQVKRLQRARHIDRLVIATSNCPDDNVIAELAEILGVHCFRGSLTDVLDRYYRAAEHFGATSVLRTTADCPLIDPQVVDTVVDSHISSGRDYTTNNMPRTWPHGLDIEIMQFAVLEEAWKNASSQAEREHVTPFIRNNPTRFRLGNCPSPVDNSRFRWTVDEPEDYEFVCRVYEELYPLNPDFLTGDLLHFLAEHPEVVEINKRHAVSA